MKKTLSTVALMALMAAVGCNNHKTDTPSAINDISPPPAPVAYQPTAAPAANFSSNQATVTPVADITPAAPMLTDTAPVGAPKAKHQVKTPVASAHTKADTTGTKKYTIKKGDNLTKIAKLEYGNTNYKKILAANPGLSADKLQVGKTIIIPQ